MSGVDVGGGDGVDIRSDGSAVVHCSQFVKWWRSSFVTDRLEPGQA